MKALLVLAALAVTGCAPFVAKQSCSVDGATLVLEESGDCAYYAAVVEDAKTTFSKTGIASGEEVSRVLSEHAIWIHKETGDFDCSGDFGSGCFNFDIELNASASALVHEMMHAIDKDRGVPSGLRRKHWKWGDLGARNFNYQLSADTLAGDTIWYFPGSRWDVATCAWRDWSNIYANHLPWARSAYYTTP